MKNRYYVTCSRCGANLDPGEKCDCIERDKVEIYKENIINMIRECNDEHWLHVIYAYVNGLLNQKKDKKKDCQEAV